MRSLAVSLVVVFASAGCVAGVTWSEFTAGNSNTSSSSSSGGPDAAVQVEAGSTTSSSSSGEAGAGPAKAACTASGLRIFGTTAFDATPANSNGKVCDPNAALVEDNDWAGLDILNTDANVTLDGVGVTSCVGVELTKVEDLAQIAVKAGPSNDACKVTPCNGPDCNTGHSLDVFAGTDRTTLKVLKRFDPVDTATTLTIDNPGPAKVIAACREQYGQGRDDMLIDVISAVCK